MYPELDSQLKMNPTTLYEHDVFDKLFKLAMYVAICLFLLSSVQVPHSRIHPI
jgi:hypothetical protein